jgi:hypothetical protein
MYEKDKRIVMDPGAGELILFSQRTGTSRNSGSPAFALIG